MDSLSQELLVYVTQGLGHYQQHMVWIPPWTWITNLWEVIMGGQFELHMYHMIWTLKTCFSQS